MQIRLRENDPPKEFRLARNVADALAASKAVTVGITPDPAVFLLSAASKVGVIKVDSVQVLIEPKIRLQRLLFLMGYVRNPKFWRDDRVQLDPEKEFAEALAYAFTRFALHATDQGLLKGYVTVEETSPVLRGRMREAAQVRQWFGRTIPLEVRYDDFTVDIPENRILLAAIERLLRLPGVSPSTRRSLARLRLKLADVSVLPRGPMRPLWQPSRLNSRYVPALELAEMILDGRSFEQRFGDLTVTGFLFDMWKVFEDFVCVALRETMAGVPGRAALQHRMSLDVDREVPMRPDFVWLRGSSAQVVVDAKYKAESPAGFPQADLYQLLAYCTVLRLEIGHLIYAKGNGTATTHRVAGSEVRVQCHTLDLSLPAPDVLRRIASLAEALLSRRESAADDSTIGV